MANMDQEAQQVPGLGQQAPVANQMDFGQVANLIKSKKHFNEVYHSLGKSQLIRGVCQVE